LAVKNRTTIVWLPVVDKPGMTTMLAWLKELVDDAKVEICPTTSAAKPSFQPCWEALLI